METIRHLNDAPGVAGEMTIMVDAGSDIVKTLGSGFWSVRQAAAFCDDWTRLVKRLHAAGRPVLALSDMAEFAVQTPEVTDILGHATSGLYADGDAIAMLVPTSLAKMQLRRTLDNRFHSFFVSPDAARTWLNARRLAGGGQERPATRVA